MSNELKYELIDHTADIGILVRGADLSHLFTNAAEAFFDLTITSKKHWLPIIDVPLIVNADKIDELLLKWLSELLFIFETRHLVLNSFWIDEIDEKHLVGHAKGIKFDSMRHEQKLSIKAVTYHGLEVKQDKNGSWHAKVIFDI